MNLQELQLLAQLIDSMEIGVEKLGKSYQKKDSEDFYKSKKTIIGFQQQVAKLVK